MFEYLDALFNRVGGNLRGSPTTPPLDAFQGSITGAEGA